jgi:hypothetical protein
VTACSGATAAYTSSPPGKGLQSMPALSFAWDGAATPTLTVKQVSDGTTAVVYSGQALIQSGIPGSLQSAGGTAGNSWEVGPA